MLLLSLCEAALFRDHIPKCLVFKDLPDVDADAVAFGPAPDSDADDAVVFSFFSAAAFGIMFRVGQR